jgi:hypothetical protein
VRGAQGNRLKVCQKAGPTGVNGETRSLRIPSPPGEGFTADDGPTLNGAPAVAVLPAASKRDMKRLYQSDWATNDAKTAIKSANDASEGVGGTTCGLLALLARASAWAAKWFANQSQ